MDVLKAINLSKTYGKGETAVHALKPVNLSIRQGEFTVVMGPSGSGKSTLLHMLAGLDTLTTGSVILDGKDINKLSENNRSIIRRRKFGFIFQFFNLIPVLTAEENILLPLLLDNRMVDYTYINELIDLLGLEKRRHHLPNALSGGEQQRVSIARALSNKPSIVFADEPTGNLDTKTGKEVLDLLKLSIKKYHQTLLMVTHDVNVAASADRILTVEDGVITGDRVVRR